MVIVFHLLLIHHICLLGYPLHFAVANPTTAHAATLPCNTQAAKNSTRILRGDINDDGDRSIADVTLMVNLILISSDDFDISIGDMDNDGEVTVADVMLLVKIILGSHYIDYENPDLYIGDAEGGDPATGL